MSEHVDLDGIEARAKDADEAITTGDMLLVQRGAAARLAREDVPALVAEVRALRSALRDVVNALGPDRICECGFGTVDCGLREEAAEALTTARAALSAKRERDEAVAEVEARASDEGKQVTGGATAGSSHITITSAPPAAQIVHVSVPRCPRCGWAR